MGSSPDQRQFATTQWSLVVAARQQPESQSRARLALAELCHAYWYPLYAFVRSRGYAAADAHDLTQSFFVRFVEPGSFAAADPAKGRFRSYLLGAVKHFLSHERERRQAKKRGGDVTVIDLDALSPEARYALEPAQAIEPDARFDREWAQEVTARALCKLRGEAECLGKGGQFNELKVSLAGDLPAPQETAQRLNMTLGAVKVAVHRLRKQYRQLLRSEIAQTVDDPADIDAEMQYLVTALLSRPQ
ncbi:MAG TPA: RNA polymerase subunit sigma-24 [Planctomycetaceae bacterium]|nr:RNA polymerase subunit sigma-24 [Planctomycetaceae bacterium]